MNKLINIEVRGPPRRRVEKKREEKKERKVEVMYELTRHRKTEMSREREWAQKQRKKSEDILKK